MITTKRSIFKYIPPLIIEFVFFGFIGWLYETILTSIVWGVFAKRGFLHLPVLPIYGFCGLFLLLILGRLKNILLVFLAGTAVTTVAELIASYMLEPFTNLWDYYSWPLNFEGRISLFSSIIFGVLCVLLVKVLHPFISWLTSKMNRKALYITAFALLAVMLGDLAIILIFGK